MLHHLLMVLSVQAAEHASPPQEPLRSGDAFHCEMSDTVVNTLFSDPEDTLDRPGAGAGPVVIEVIDAERRGALATGVHRNDETLFRFTYNGGAVSFVHLSDVELESGSMAMLSVFTGSGEGDRYRANLYVQDVRAGEPVATRLSIGWCTHHSSPA